MPFRPVLLGMSVDVGNAQGEAGGNKAETARRLGISKATLWRRLKQMDAKGPSAGWAYPLRTCLTGRASMYPR